MFDHTSREPGMWRAWTKSGQECGLYWGSKCPVGFKLGQHRRSKHFWIGLGLIQVFIPRGVDQRDKEFDWGDEPTYGCDVSREFGLVWHWGFKRWQRDLPFGIETLVWEYEGADGLWHSKLGPWVPFEDRPAPASLEYSYTYVLRSGKIQHRCATIHRERWVLGRKTLHKLGWPTWTHNDIEIEFSGEVGERSGSWKGGCIGCSYRQLPGETPLETLRRMEAERRF